MITSHANHMLRTGARHGHDPNKKNFLLMEYQTEATRWMDIPLEITRAIQRKYPEDNKGSDGPLPKSSLFHFL